MKKPFLIVLAVLAVGCDPRRTQECPPTTTRCVDNRVELCDAEGRWLVVADCDQLSRMSDLGWVCSAVPFLVDGGVVDDHSCVPQHETALVARGGGS
jgi:hypothetical protein